MSAEITEADERRKVEREGDTQRERYTETEPERVEKAMLNSCLT